MLLLSFWAILLAILCTYNDDMDALFRPKKDDAPAPEDQRNVR